MTCWRNDCVIIYSHAETDSKVITALLMLLPLGRPLMRNAGTDRQHITIPRMERLGQSDSKLKACRLTPTSPPHSTKLHEIACLELSCSKRNDLKLTQLGNPTAKSLRDPLARTPLARPQKNPCETSKILGTAAHQLQQSLSPA